VTSEKPAAPDQFSLSERVENAYLGKNRSGQEVLLVPLGPGRLPIGRATGGVRLSFFPAVEYKWGPKGFQTPTAVLTCEDGSLNHTFKTLARDIALRVGTIGDAPSAQDVADAFVEWQELLRARRRLSLEEQVGLWGELWLLTQMDDLTHALTLWRGVDSGRIDFVGGGIGIECKTSLRGHVHLFSLDQVERPLGDTPVYVVSLWIERDDSEGISLPSMIASLRQRLAEKKEFDKKLLRLGYVDGDSQDYDASFRTLEEPKWLALEQVPRVRGVDPGVSRVVFEVSLQAATALDAAFGVSLLHRLSRVPPSLNATTRAPKHS
jgi:hypothetical protein